MSKINNGGAAFPIPNDDRPGSYEAHPGMTLRDWFAGQALASVASDDALFREFQHDDSYGDAEYGRFIADHCYSIADAMIAAREKGGAS